MNARQAPASRKISPARRSLLLAMVRPVATVAALVVGYYLLPLDRPLDVLALVILIVSLCLVAVIVIWQARVILRSHHPTLQGLQALALIVPLFLLVFANAYYVLAYNQPASFSDPLTRTDALYFVITVFATVGFGDISPVTQLARILVIIQMIGNMLVVGGVLRVLLTAVEHGRQRASTRPG